MIETRKEKLERYANTSVAFRGWLAMHPKATKEERVRAFDEIADHLYIETGKK